MKVKKQKEGKQKTKTKKGKPKINYKKSHEQVEKISGRYEYLYVYGIINNKDIIVSIKGLRNMPIQKINFKDTAVLFSFYPVLHPILEEKETMLYSEILNKLAGKTAVIPMAVGTVFKNQEILEAVLDKSYETAKKTLELIKDKIELGVKVVKKDGEEVSGKVNQDILEELNKLSIKSVAGDKFSERLLLNHSFLVVKNNFVRFSDKIGELEKKNSGLKFIYTGPWPVYSFCNINVTGG